MKITLKPVMKKPEIGDIVMNDCDTPYLFQWGVDDFPDDEEWPVVFSSEKVKATVDSYGDE